jgi:D-alanyl-D-alanine carboxypeptidase/D-alanyl-D-alanine-endopeptidase (penicillin-binding protein 4)
MRAILVAIVAGMLSPARAIAAPRALKTAASQGAEGSSVSAQPAAAPSAASASATAGGAGPNGGASAGSAATSPASDDSATAGAGSGPGRLPGLSPRPVGLADFPRPPADLGQRRQWLKLVLDDTFAQPALAKSRIGVLVVESDTGRPLYARGEKTALNAASNVKIVTASAALALLGPDYRWKTTLSVIAASKGTGPGGGGEIAGDLFLRGFGDPTLDTQDLNAMATDVAAAGIRRIKGAIVADESFFDGTHIGPAYDQKADSTSSRAPSAGLSVNGNVVEVTVVPAGKAGAAARVLTDPPVSAFVISGRIVTASGGPALATVETQESEDGRTQIVVSGRVRLGTEPRTYKRRVISPPLIAASTLRTLLERRGITVGQGPHLGVTPAQGMRILSNHDSAPLAVVVHELNKRSNNFTAEQLLRTLGAEMGGRPGTWDKGLDAVGRYLSALGIRKGSYQMTNGSGLYDSNRFSPEQITIVLRGALRDFRIAAEFMSSLAIAGTDGTIGHRMSNTPAERFVRAKTGTLANTSCLSGFAGSPGRSPLIFSILMNDVPGPADARRAQDRAAELLVRYIEADTPVKP